MSKKSQVFRFIKKKDAKKIKSHSLVSRAPLMEHVIDEISAISEDLELALLHEIRRIVSDVEIQVEIGKPTEDAPRKKGHVQAAFSADDPDNRAVMAVPPETFGALSELFFGGSPANISNKELSKRTISDTEKRLANRIFNVFIETVATAFNQPFDRWTDQWLEKNKKEDVAWVPVKVSSDDWDFTLSFGWPYELSDREAMTKKGIPEDLPEQMINRLLKIPMILNTEVAKMAISVDDMASLRPGLILPIGKPGAVTAKAGNQTIISGSMHEMDDRIGLKIEFNELGASYE